MKLRLAVIYVAVIYGLLFGLSQLSRIPVFQVVTREFTQSSNVFLNDLYFRLDHWGRDHETQVTLVNTGGLPRSKAEFHEALKTLILRLESSGVASVGVDLLLSPEILAQDSAWLNLLSSRKIKLGVVHRERYDSNCEVGSVVLPVRKGESVRSYSFQGPNSVLPSLAEAMVGGKEDLAGETPLRFLGDAKGVNVVSCDGGGQRLMNQGGFAALEGHEVMRDSTNGFAPWLKERHVIVAHLGSDSIMNPFDSEDKHRTAADPVSLTQRERKTPGAVVHALAVETLLNTQKLKMVVAPNWLRSAVLFLFVLGVVYVNLFFEWGKRINALVMAFFSVPLLIGVLCLMNIGIYWPISSSLVAFLFLDELVEIIDPVMRRICPAKFFPEA